ncbi:hypothetical protein ACFV6E_03805 [Streptomyces sp. NPDC059785]
MELAHYVVYDAETGMVVGLHTEPAALHSPRGEILRQHDPQGRRPHLRVARLPEGTTAGRGSRVVDGRLEVVAQDGTEFGGTVLLAPVDDDTNTRHYVPQPPPADT